MSVDKNNQTYKKTSFLTGVNSDYIEEYYSLYLQNRKLLPNDWIEFFDGLKEDTNIVINNIKGPSWSPKKSNLTIQKQTNNIKVEREISDIASTKQSSKDSLRAIMLIRAYRIRGHLIANLDPLNLQAKDEHPELKPETYGFGEKDFDRKIFLDGVLGIQYGTLKEILKILKKLIVLKLDMSLCI